MSITAFLLLLFVVVAHYVCNQIIWNNRLKGGHRADCTMSCDCVDFGIPNQGPAFSSHKFKKKSGLRYETCLCIQTGDVIWINGPRPCGRYPDMSIFCYALMSKLGDAERVESDDGYIGEAPLHSKCPKSFVNPEECECMQQRVRNRQETINKRLKEWGVLRNMFRHVDKLHKHGNVVRALLVMTQISINLGKKLFECGCKDPPLGEDSNDNKINTD